jgi:hypothetical protein
MLCSLILPAGRRPLFGKRSRNGLARPDDSSFAGVTVEQSVHGKRCDNDGLGIGPCTYAEPFLERRSRIHWDRKHLYVGEWHRQHDIQQRLADERHLDAVVKRADPQSPRRHNADPHHEVRFGGAVTRIQSAKVTVAE